MQRTFHVLSSTFVLLASTGAVAQDRAYDPKALAHYDASFGRCEAQFPDMKGHRDEAYLSLWRATLNDKTKARLADARGSAAYKAERARSNAAAAKPDSAENAKKVEQECRALHGEMVRGRK